MKTLFAKYNRERLPKFQTVTKIVELDSGQQKAIKQALMPEAQQHIAEIYANYTRLTTRYPQIKLVPPTREDATTVSFPMANGISLENLLKQALDKQDKCAFFALLDKFAAYIDSFVAERQVKFVPCEKFKQVFGEWTLDEPQDLIELANVDMIFSNLFIADDGSITQIDYEWVFDFKIPKKLLLFRVCNDYLNRVLKNETITFEIEQLFKLFNLDETTRIRINDNCIAQYHFIVGLNGSYFLNEKILKSSENVEFILNHLKYVNQVYNPWSNSVLQLFYDIGHGFNSNHYLQQIANDSIVHYEFSLSEVFGIQGIRLDPLNLPSHIRLISAQVVAKGGIFYPLHVTWHNADLVIDNRYSFYHNDPIWTFDWSNFRDIDYDKVVFEFELVLIDINELSNFLVRQLAVLRSKDAELSLTQLKLNDTQNELTASNEKLNNTQYELTASNEKLNDTQSKLTAVYQSQSWKITKPLRKFCKLFKG